MIWNHSETKPTISSSDEGDVPGTAASLPIDAFPLLESMYPRDSSESEKAAYLWSLFQMALRLEDDL
jgi:hypothetical protein